MPIESIKNPLGGTKLTLLKKEYSIGFIALFVGVFKRLQLLPRCSFFRFFEIILNKLFVSMYQTPLKYILAALDKLLATIFGGYLIVSIAKNIIWL